MKASGGFCGSMCTSNTSETAGRRSIVSGGVLKATDDSAWSGQVACDPGRSVVTGGGEGMSNVSMVSSSG